MRIYTYMRERKAFVGQSGLAEPRGQRGRPPVARAQPEGG